MEVIQTTQELQDRLEKHKPNDVLLDVRTGMEFSLGHIPGAVNLNAESFEDLDSSKTYIVICASGSRAEYAAYQLHQKGFKVVYSAVGVAHWARRGLPLTR